MFRSSTLMISTTSAPRTKSGVGGQSEGQIQSHRPYIRASEAAVRVSLEGSESRVEPGVWRGRRAEWSPKSGESRSGKAKGCVDTTAVESLPAPRQSEVIGPRHSSRIAEERTGS